MKEKISLLLSLVIFALLALCGCQSYEPTSSSSEEVSHLNNGYPPGHDLNPEAHPDVDKELPPVLNGYS